MNKRATEPMLSVVISAYNEEKQIEECLKSVEGIADETIVIDNTSSDNTIKIAKKYTSKIFIKPNNQMLNINKNFGFSKAAGLWILSLDADERVSDELAKEIRARVKSGTLVEGYWIPRKNIIFGKWIKNSIWWPDYQLRLFRNGKGKFLAEHVHEMIVIDGQTEKLSEPLIHYNYASVSQYLTKLDKIYTENESDVILKSGKKLMWIDAIRMPASDFLKTFFYQKGYRDGLHGLVLSLLQAFYAEIVFAKTWEKQGFPEYNSSSFVKDVWRELSRAAHECYYWFLSVAIDETQSSVKKVLYKLLRRKVKKHIQ